MDKLFLRIAAMSMMPLALLNAAQDNHFYVGANAGIFQANFDNQYTDLVDVIPQNITQPVLQNSYTGGLSLGYINDLSSPYFLGFELNANLDGGRALFQSGAQSSAFTDVLKLKNHVDLDLVPGLSLSSTLKSYLKLGISWAHLSDSLNSPVGYNPVYQNYPDNETITGFAAGIGLRKIVNDRVSVFAEYNYHDYGNVDLASFQNFTASYAHNVHVYTNSVNVGAMYFFKVS